ncbi:hypothetical protein [Sideroxydans lithotrophicus]|uniref:hypothetical protein n=1 Tax=Sideroxydans lithotrophicus TaxID=63745 RepID=UPI00059B89EA|nr:hypothetical protein [Sideroxydans lithotrophicus]
MGNVIKFPCTYEREWAFYEDTIRKSCVGTFFNEAVIENSLPAIKEHWKTIYEDVSLQTSSVEIPGPLTDAQTIAIRRSVDAAVSVVVERLKLERSKSMDLLIQAELMLAYVSRHGDLPPQGWLTQPSSVGTKCPRCGFGF